ncbi:MAG: hypothetical protein QM778_00640 [Myxococcales bacterium]
MADTWAIWVPFWYDLDISIAVGEHGSFPFEAEASAAGRLVFANGPSEPAREVERSASIVSIVHPTIGQTSRVSAKGLAYHLTLADGTELQVDTEQVPGQVFSVSDRRWAHLEHTSPEWLLNVLVRLEPDGSK